MQMVKRESSWIDRVPTFQGVFGVHPKKETIMDQNTKPLLSLHMQGGPRTSRYGKQLPHYKGYVARPDSEVKRDAIAWSGEYTDKDGVVLTYLSGQVEPVSRGMSAMDQVKARAGAAEKAPPVSIGGKDGQKPIVLEDGRFIIFEAKHKDGTNIAANGKRRADNYGYWNDGGELIQLGGYVNAQEGRLASIVGKTQFPLSKEQLETTGGEMSQSDIDAMNSLAEDGYEREAEAHGAGVLETEHKPSRRSRGGR